MKLTLVAGARPNFMKVAPIIRAIDKRNNTSSSKLIEPMLVHTGQHYDYEMSQVFFQDLDLPQPALNLGVGSGSHAEQTGKVMIEFERVLLEIDQLPQLPGLICDLLSDGEIRRELGQKAKEFALNYLWTWEERMEEEITLVEKIMAEHENVRSHKSSKVSLP